MVLLLFFAAPLSATVLNGDRDFQLWIHTRVLKKNEKTKIEIGFENEFRYGADATKLFLVFFQGTVRKQVYKWLKLGPGYRHFFTFDDQLKRWETTYDPLFDVLVHFEVQKWEVLLRSRTQYFVNQFLPDSWTERVLLEVDFPFTIAKMRPYFYEEVFFRKRDGFGENRLGAGLRLPVSTHFNLNGQFFSRHILDTVWVTHRVLRIYLNSRF